MKENAYVLSLQDILDPVLKILISIMPKYIPLNFSALFVAFFGCGYYLMVLEIPVAQSRRR